MAPQDSNTAHALLARAHSPTTASRIYTDRVQHRPLLLKPTSHPPTAQSARRVLRQQKLSARKKLKPKPLSARQRRALGLYDIPRCSQTYEIYLPLHALWLGYIRSVLGIDERGNGEEGREMQLGVDAAAKLCAADWNGAMVEVVRSKCVGRVGIRGIVVRDSRGVFEIVTQGNALKVVPKEGTVFGVRISRNGMKMEGVNGEGEAEAEVRKDLVFELHGNQFIYRAADRANRKFKSHFLPDV